jgi:hypothetical protein
MKKEKPQIKKIVLKKETITKLNSFQLMKLVGGDGGVTKTTGGTQTQGSC